MDLGSDSDSDFVGTGGILVFRDGVIVGSSGCDGNADVGAATSGIVPGTP